MRGAFVVHIIFTKSLQILDNFYWWELYINKRKYPSDIIRSEKEGIEMKIKPFSVVLVFAFILLFVSVSLGQPSQVSYGWTKIMGGTLYDSCYAITTDFSGNVYVTGFFSGTVNFGLDFGTTDNKTSAGQGDIFIAKLESGEAVMPPENPAISRVVNNYIFYKEFINRVSWQAPSTQPVPIAKYIVYRTPLGGSSFMLVAEVEASIFKYEDRGLRKDELYTYRITSVDIYGRESTPVEVSN